MTDEAGNHESTDLRELAISRIKKKTEFKAHVVAYVIVNSFLVAIWAGTGRRVLLADLPDARLGHRCGVQRLGCIPALGPDGRRDPARDGSPPRITRT